MTMAWRVSFVLFAVLVAAGGPQHPKGTMEQMLADPKWVPAHALMLAGFVALLIGLILFGRGRALPPRTRRWLRWAVAGAIAQTVEMALHTAAAVDAANLVAHRSTPVLTTHLAFAVAAYPFFAATLIGFIVAAAKERALGSPWIAPVGILGAAAHGASAPLVVAFDVPGAGVLFPLLMLVALWALVAAFWPARVSLETKEESMKRVLVTLLIAVAISAGFVVGRASADQPMMHSALEHLRAARADLEKATNDKGGHRAAAIKFTNDAIAEVERGMAFDRRH